jgi:hypothetical protein
MQKIMIQKNFYKLYLNHAAKFIISIIFQKFNKIKNKTPFQIHLKNKQIYKKSCTNLK